MPQIVIPEFMDDDAVAWLASRHDTLYDPALVEDRARLLGLGGGQGPCGLIVRNRTRVDAALLAAWPALRAVGRLGVGLDNIDTDACAARGIAVMPATGGNTVSVAEYVLGAILTLRRRALMDAPGVLSGGWPRTRAIGQEIAESTLGLVGFGAIARAVADRARVFGMKIAAYDPFLPAGDPAWTGVQRFEALDDLLAAADAVSLHVPLTDTTRGLFDDARLAAMKPGALLINTARGGVVDEPALAAALRQGRLGGAALDVFDSEPLPAGSALADVPNLIATPHIAGVTEQSNTRISWMTVRNLAAALEGASA